MNRTPTPRIFSHMWTHFILVHMHRMAQGLARRVCIKERSSTRHHVSDCALSLSALTYSSLSSASTTSLISSSLLSWSSSSMWSKPTSSITPAHTQNEECCPVLPRGRETSAVSGMRVMIVRNRHRKPLHLQKHEVEVCREKEMPEADASL